MLTKFPRINYRIFRNQPWPVGLEPFRKFNVIYGWNGSGKTTLSALLRKLEKRESLPPSEGTFDIEVDGTTVAAMDFDTNKALPPLKVFNRDFVEASVFAGTTSLQRIYYFGENSVEIQKEIEVLHAEHAKETEANLRLKDESERATDTEAQFRVEQARHIKKLLSSSGANPYNNYDKRTFNATCDILKNKDYAKCRLNERQQAEAKKKKELQPQDDLTAIDTETPDLTKSQARATRLLQTTVVSRVLPDLAKNPVIAHWVQMGIPLHTENATLACRFCNQPLPGSRLKDLENHFNQEYQQLIDDLAIAIADCESAQNSINGIKPPAKDSFYPHLRTEYFQHSEALKTFQREASAFLTALSEQLIAKKNKPFEALDLAVLLTVPAPDHTAATRAITALNSLVRQHNETSINLAAEVNTARKALEKDSVAESLPNLLQRHKDTQQKLDAFNSSTKRIGEIAEKISALEEKISDTLQPAAELTRELTAYLGQGDLSFEQKGNGYVITRNGVVAQHLSEGEKTAVSFLYFLKSLHDRSFNGANGIVVIDDPISSLDANAIFSAFGYMRELTKHAAQLFVLTHNFTFFRQVKNWFSNCNKGPKQKGKPLVASFYMLRTSAPEGGRTSQFMPLDPLLLDFESEYHYLFHCVSEEAQQRPHASLAEYYAMPNIARRLLEAFFSFRFPNEDSFQQQLNRATDIEEAKRARMIRFLHTHSHDGKVNEPEHDLSILSETPQILKDVLDLIEKVDSSHFAEMQVVLATATKNR